MSDWEESILPPAHLPTTTTWSDEEEKSEASSVADAWDASDSEEAQDVSKPKTTPSAEVSSTPSGQTKPKKRSIKQAIAERQQNQQARLQEKVEVCNDTESPETLRARLQRQMEEEDSKHVQDLFDGMGGKPTPELNLLTFTPRTSTEFNEYLGMVLARFADFDKRPMYAAFIDQLAHKLCERMTKLEDIRKVASTLNALANDRQRHEKETQKKGKKVNIKKQIRVDADDDFPDPDANAYYAGDYDDFM